MPLLSFTRRRTSSPSVSISALVASPVLMRKLVCFSLTCAPPTMKPRQPASSTSCQALCPSGFLKVEPPVFERSGCERSEEHTSELQSLMRISYAVFCLKKKKTNNNKIKDIQDEKA